MFGAVRVLVADGDGAFRSRLTKAAGERGLVCVGAVSDGAAAAELLGRYCPELLITDIPLRGVDGLTLLALAGECRTGKRTVCAVATANRDPAVENAARTLGAAILEHKPCSADRVLDAALRLYFEG